MKNASLILTIGVAVLVVIALLNAFFVMSLDSKLDTKLNQLKEASRAPSISLTIINADCDQCTSLNELVQSIKGSHVNITQEVNMDDVQAAPLISKYGITTLPALVVRGELDKFPSSGFEAKEDALIYQTTTAPYFNVATQEVEGVVSAWILQADCEECLDMQTVVDAFEQQGVAFSEVETFSQGSADSSRLVSLHKINRLPALLFSDDISAYPEVLQAMVQGGFVKSGDIHLYQSMLPYYNISASRVQGLVDVTYLSDTSCMQCYDVSIHQQILQRFGMALGQEQTYDISSTQGKALVSTYGITSVPAVVVGGDVGLYEGFDEVWSTVGTIEKDGSYIFRNNGVFGEGFAYKNLTSGQVVVPPSAASERA